LDDKVEPAYFRTAGTPVIEGREFTEADTESAPKVAIVNEEFAKRNWPGQILSESISDGKRWAAHSGCGDDPDGQISVSV